MSQRTPDPRARAAIDSGLARLEEQRSWLDQLPASIGSILDIGCGAGFHSKYFLDRGMKPVALDAYSGAFQFHGEIEFRNCAFQDLGEERFDAVFASHVLEHCPDVMSALLSWRERVADGGYLIVIVPRYTSLVCNDHYSTGWNIGQLAMLLVAAGFDCSQSHFAELGIHVCGFGRKAELPACNMNLEASLPYLPAALARSVYTDGVHRFLEGGLASASAAEVHHKPVSGGVAIPHFTLDAGRDLRFREQAWHGIDVVFDAPMDLGGGPVHVAVAAEGEPSHLRLAFASGPPEDWWADVAEVWFSVAPGFHHFSFHPYHLTALRGQPDLAHVRAASFGGNARFSSFRFWVCAADGRNLLPVQPDVPPQGTTPYCPSVGDGPVTPA
jgi:SAM-dependent methyltransferase